MIRQAYRFLPIVVVLLTLFARGQGVIFPGLYGQQLSDSLKQFYKPATVLSYTESRNLMFTFLDNENDSVTCVYTGFKIYLNHNSTDPIQEALSAGINTEHTWPQSLGASGNAKSDLHHLFSARVDVNNDRGNLRFDEIPDQLTDRWYRLNYQQTTIPTSFIDEYSEVQFNTRFEPREDFKGNIARAIFYFYTMYKDQSDTNFFYIQKDVLRSWNSLDTVDAAERLRNSRIAQEQDGKPNPFVVDTTLVNRAYFHLVGIADDGSGPGERLNFRLYQNYPNPFNPETAINYQLSAAGDVQLAIFNMLGEEVRTLVNMRQTTGNYIVRWDGRNESGIAVSSGIYFYQLRVSSLVITKKMFLIR